MASISNDPNGKRRILFTDANGKRQTIWLGTMTKKAAISLLARIEELVQNRIAGVHPSAELLAWIRSLPDLMRRKLVRVGLLDAAPATLTVEGLIDRFIEHQHVKPSTMDAYRQTTESLKSSLGAGTPIDRITTSDVDSWRKSLAAEGYATATVAKRVIVAKGIFSRAVRWKLIEESPFDHLKAGSQANHSRAVHISREVVLDLLPHCPDTRWQAILALARFGGLRCPSELAELRWGDINWEKVVMTVRSPKTEHHDGKGIRVVPVDPALQPILWKLWEEADEGVDRLLPKIGTASNLRTMLLRILGRAGVKPWPRLFQNLRASCETDWVDQFPAHQVAAWLGHSPAVAREHYLQPRDHHVAKASGGGPWIQSAATENHIAENIAPEVKTASQNASQQGSASSRNPSHQKSANS
jgi:integrase